MATSPYLVRDGEELRLDVSVGSSRRQLALTDRALTLLADDLGYGNADVLPWVTARALVLAGGARLPEGGDARDTAWGLTGADGGRKPTADELRAVADYLRSVRVDERAVETLREHVRSTRLSDYVDPDELSSKADRVHGLSDIARDL